MLHRDVTFPSRSHPVWIGEGILSEGRCWPAPTGGSRIALICYDRALEPHLGAIETGLRHAGWEPQHLALEGSEALKNFEQIYPLYAEFLARGLQRSSLLVAAGGGTVGDAIGFLAASFLRGLPWVNVPSTLLAQVDSGLGGKTGVNHAAGKNLIGAIYQPMAVICELTLLAGISTRDRVSGLGEMLKYGLIADADFWFWLLENQSALLKGRPAPLEQAVARSLEIKARYVAADEQDLTGVRAELNFGHTFGHALEAVTGYGTLRHGEAVIYGMLLASWVSAQEGLLNSASAEAILSHLRSLPLPPLPALDAEALERALLQDKKSEGSAIACILLTSLGKATRRQLPVSKLVQAFAALPELLAGRA
ncbi:MAG: 3-dehydroquinate synthase family protein [Candidatus Sericytochromatia bacterium]